jgi:hypothetical protein
LDDVKGLSGTFLAPGSAGPEFYKFSLRRVGCQCSIHRSVSDGADEWEYAELSVRDMASIGFLSSRLVGS